MTPIYYALVPPDASAATLVDVLIDAGADVNGGAARLGLPLRLIVGSGRPELVDQLLRASANPNNFNDSNWTALHYAAMCDDVNVARALLKGGAHPDVADDEGLTPLDVALAHGAHATAAVLRHPPR